MRNAQKNTLNPWLTAGGFGLLVYAVLGNYVALPGYIRFLERGGTSAAGSTFDLSVLFGATRTILWMYSFQLGVLAIAIAQSIRDGLHTTYLAVGVVVWLALWSLQGDQTVGGKLNRTVFLGAMVFFAFAIWEVCGLGSTGRILHPEQLAQPLAHNIVVTQSSKLMFEFLLAWGLLWASTTIGRGRTVGAILTKTFTT